MTFPAAAIPGILAEEEVIVETVYAATDDATGEWEADDATTTDLWDHVNSESDADHVELRNATVFVSGTTNTAALRFIMTSPSEDPSSKQTVRVKVRAEYIDVFGAANPDAGDPNVTLELLEGTTSRASGSAQALSTTPAEYELTLTEAQINSFTSWSDIRVEMNFEASGIDVDEEIDIQVYRVRVEFDE